MEEARNPFKILRLALLVLLYVTNVFSYDENVCIPPTDTCGPIAPYPPKTYVARIEVVDELYKTTTHSDEFYDPEREMLAVTHTTRGLVIHAIFYYETDTAVIIQVQGIEEGKVRVACMVDEIEDAAPWFVGYDKNGTYGFMLAPSQALFFGGDYKYSFVDSDPVRSIPCNRWDSCIETYGNGTMKVKYEWTNPQLVYDVTGYAQERPVMANVSGYYYSPRGMYEQVNVDTVYNFGFFDANPVWEDYQWAFEIPSTIYCPGLPTGKSPPTQLADTYSMRVEVNLQRSRTKQKEFVSMAKNWYDFGRKLTRGDYIPDPYSTEGYYVGFHEAAVIRDFRSGVEYIIDKGLGNCTTIPIPDTGYDVIVDPSGHITIKDPLTLFGLGQVSNLTYYGKKKARGLPCDVWVGVLQQQVENSSMVEDFMYEVYFLEDGWHEISGSGSLPEKLYPEPVLIKIQEAFISVDPDYSEVFAFEQNIFKFDQSELDMTVFDITPCFSGHDQIRRFQMAFPGEFRDEYDNRPNMFLRSIHGTLEEYLQIPTIRIQHMTVEFSEQDGRLYCEFTLVDRPPVSGIDWPISVGPPLGEVVTALENSMSNFFVIIFDENYDTPGHMKKMKAYEDSLREMFEDSCNPLKSTGKSTKYKHLSIPENQPEKTKPSIINVGGETPVKEMFVEMVDDDTQDFTKMSLLEKLNGEFYRFTSYSKMTRSTLLYTPGDMAGMGIGMLLLGLLLGTVAMLAGLRKFGLTEGMEFIPLSSRRS